MKSSRLQKRAVASLALSAFGFWQFTDKIHSEGFRVFLRRNLAERLRWLGRNNDSEPVEVGTELDWRRAEGRAMIDDVLRFSVGRGPCRLSVLVIIRKCWNVGIVWRYFTDLDAATFCKVRID